MFTQLQLKAWFTYDPITGFLVWINSDAGRNGLRAGSNRFRDGAPQRRVVHIGSNGKYTEAKIIWCWMTGIWPPNVVDHIDLNPFNNKWSNLRLATNEQNYANRRKYGANLLKWVQEINPGKYRGRVCAYGKRISTEYYNTPQEAHAAALALATKLHGQFLHP